LLHVLIALGYSVDGSLVIDTINDNFVNLKIN